MNQDHFQRPPNIYGEVPFWSWNDNLDPQELTRQVALMAQGGWGGFFMHARVGLRTPYLGEEWLECVRASVAAARAHGLYAWLYDEDKWPSGFAGGLSVAAHPNYRTQCLFCKVDNRPALLAERIATFTAREVEGELVDITPWPSSQPNPPAPFPPREGGDLTPNPFPSREGESPLPVSGRGWGRGSLSRFGVRPGERLVQFYVQTMPLGDAKFNDYAYLDLLNPDAVRAFLDSTHEVYAQAVGDEAPSRPPFRVVRRDGASEEFGQTVPGIFTDEPCALFYGRRWPGQTMILPWTGDFPEYFRARTGYDLLPHLPSLFFDVGDFHRLRYDYWRAITERFVAAFTRQYYAWCEAHHLAYTGHYMCEDSLLEQIRWMGAAMPHYAYMHFPGVDKLGRLINSEQGTVLTIKQLDSVVCQMGKERALCENYGCAGQDFAHTGRKWLGDWAYVLGINLNNPHLALYSMRGERKRDYPANLFYQQPWWPENRLIADYFARLSYALSQGRRVADILVIHPIGSAWTLYRPGAPQAVRQLDQALHALAMALLSNHRDFHLGDELLMENECAAHVRHDETGPQLVVGAMAYRLVIVPPGVTLAANTVRLLREFAAAGGPVLALEPVPTLIDGRPADTPVLPPNTRLVALSALPAVLDEFLPFDVRIPGHPAIWCHHRRLDPRNTGRSEPPVSGQHATRGDCYFLANTDLHHGGPATVHLRGTGRLEEWDAATGEVRPLPSRQQEGRTEVVLDFPPVGSHLLVLHREQPPAEVAPVVERVVAEFPLGDTWDLALSGPNALTLDVAQLRLGEGDWSSPLYILRAHDQVAQAGPGTPFGLRFTFDAEAPPALPLYLVLESPERFTITVNGQPVPSTDCGWWTDTAFRQVDISAAVRAGRNEILLTGVFTRDTTLESVYLLGNCGVAARRLRQESRVTGQLFDRYAADFRLTPLPARAQAKRRPDGLALDLTTQGLPFFAGRATLRQAVTLPLAGERVVLVFRHLRAALAHVRVNDQHVGTVAWEPHRVDLTAAWRPGENVIAIELVGTLRNLLGPHHLTGGDLGWTGPEQFRDYTRWTDDYVLVPFGFDGVSVECLE